MQSQNSIAEPNAVDSSLDEDLALATLKRPDLTPEEFEQLGKSGAATKSRKVKLAIIGHPKAPRYVSLALIRQLFTFDLMRVALIPVVAGDLKRFADEVLLNRLESITIGEKLALARRASGRVAGQLLLDTETRVVHAALQNPMLTEVSIVRALLREDSSSGLVQAVCRDAKWSLRREIRVALLRNEKTPVARALEFAAALPPRVVREALQQSRMAVQIKAQVLKNLPR